MSEENNTVTEQQSRQVDALVSLPERVIELCEKRGWSTHWTDRLAYLGLEASEFVEAIRGKNGDPVEEAGDVIITALALIVPNGVSLEDALVAAHKKIDRLTNTPKYEGEEYTEAN